MTRLFRLITSLLLAAAAVSAAAAPLSPQQRALHLLNRLGYGPRPGDLQHVLDIGIERYLELQLRPESIPLPETLTQRLAALPAAAMPPGQALAEFLAAREAAEPDGEAGSRERQDAIRRLAEQAAEARLARAIDSPRQLEEVMVDFWFNHFNVFAGKGLDRALVASYERDAIRPYALGRFRDLLGATAKHPAMLFYLDNWLSAAPGFRPAGAGPDAAGRVTGLNENYARELMELHTLGVDGGYTQKDVTELARMLTGWSFNPRLLARGGPAFRFEARRHDWSDKEWLGRHVAARGQAEGEWALDVLAAHPATARHIAYELAQYFVADRPPPALVERLARRFLETDGDIRAVLAALFSSPEFWNPAHVGNKFKTPYQFVVSAVRAAQVDVANARPLLGALAGLGMPLYGCQTPDGYKNTEEAWLNPDALMRRINFATALASGRLPLAGPADTEEGRMMERRMNGPAQPGPADARRAGPPLDAARLLDTLGDAISHSARDAVAAGPQALRAALVLGSPDFMRH